MLGTAVCWHWPCRVEEEVGMLSRGFICLVSQRQGALELWKREAQRPHLQQVIQVSDGQGFPGEQAVSWGNEGGERCQGTLRASAKLPICPTGDKGHGGLPGAAPKSGSHGSGSLVRMEKETKGNKMPMGTAV